MLRKTIVAVLCLAFVQVASAGFIDARVNEKPVAAKDAANKPAAEQVGGDPKAEAPASTPAPSVTPATPKFDVREGDRTIRDVLVRWAKTAGWVHEPIHWAVTEDYSIAGYAGEDVFGSEFRSAVRILISSTELTARAAQPCFYSNNVVRVIPRISSCAANTQ
jgi:hypothetical protein